LDEEDEDDISGSDADVSGESSDTSSNKDEDDTVEKMFIKCLVPGGAAYQAGLMKGILGLKKIYVNLTYSIPRSLLVTSQSVSK
jgi:hypothetical protein